MCVPADDGACATAPAIRQAGVTTDVGSTPRSIDDVVAGAGGAPARPQGLIVGHAATGAPAGARKLPSSGLRISSSGTGGGGGGSAIAVTATDAATEGAELGGAGCALASGGSLEAAAPTIAGGGGTCPDCSSLHQQTPAKIAPMTTTHSKVPPPLDEDRV
jgi:hypothetical protein